MSAGCVRAAHLFALRPSDGFAAGPFAVDVVQSHFPLKSVAVDAQQFRRLRLIRSCERQRAFDHAFFQDLDRLLQKQASCPSIAPMRAVKTFFHWCPMIFRYCSQVRAAPEQFEVRAYSFRKLDLSSMGAIATKARDASSSMGAICEFSIDEETIPESTDGPKAVKAVSKAMATSRPRARPKTRAQKVVEKREPHGPQEAVHDPSEQTSAGQNAQKRQAESPSRLATRGGTHVRAPRRIPPAHKTTYPAPTRKAPPRGQ